MKRASLLSSFIVAVALVAPSFLQAQAKPRTVEIEGTDQMKYSVASIEAKPGEQTADPPARDHPEVDAQLMRFGAGQDLQHREQAVEAPGIDPAFFLDQRLTQHCDLRDRAAEREGAEAQEFEE